MQLYHHFVYGDTDSMDAVGGAEVLCKKPFRVGAVEHGCGQCMPCRLNRRRLWTSRIMLESFCHESSVFLTLTYSPEHCDDDLHPEHLRDYWKRLRKALAPRKIRYYAVGEYGDESGRPHYHAALFGVSGYDAPLVTSCWGYGYSHVGDLNPTTAAYISGYVTKKMTSKDDWRLAGRHPEFARMSNRPGIGALAMNQFGQQALTRAGAQYIAANGDVINKYRFDGVLWPLGRYLRSILREQVTGSRDTPESVVVDASIKARDEALAEGFVKRFSRRLAENTRAESRAKIQAQRKRSRNETL